MNPTRARVLAWVAFPLVLAGCPSDADSPGKDLKPLSAALKIPVCSPDGWCWQRPLPQGNDLTGIWGASATDVWVAGDGATLHWDGEEWTQWIMSQDLRFHAFWGAAANDQWALTSGDAGGILRFHVRHWDGASWTVAWEAPDGVILEGLWGSGPDDVWVAGSVSEWSGRGATVLRHWDGTQWADTAAGRTGSAHAVWGTGPSDVWTGGDYLPLLHWDGTAWTEAPGERTSVMAFWGSGPDDVWAGGSGGLPLHWDGHSWSLSAGEALFTTVTSMWGSGPGDVWGVTDRNAVIHWDGRSWTTAWSPETWEPLGAVWGSATNDVWIAAGSGRLAHWDGTTWTLPEAAARLNRVHGTGADDVWAVGGTVLHWDGTSWTDRTAGLEPWVSKRQLLIEDFVINGPADVWATGQVQAESGTTDLVLHWDGDRWTRTADHRGIALWASAPDDLWMLKYGNPGSKVLRGDGTTWAEFHDFGPDVNPRSIWGTGPNDVWVVGQQFEHDPGGGARGHAWIAHWDGRAWTIQDPGLGEDIQLADVHGSGPSDAWAVGSGATTFHWDGTAWRKVDVPGVSGNTCLGRVHVAGPADAWVIDQLERTGTLHWDGTTWSSVDAGTWRNLSDVYAAAEYVWIVNAAGGIVARMP